MTDTRQARSAAQQHGRADRHSGRRRPDLFWGNRGGGSNLGIVTEFTYRLHPLGPVVLSGRAICEIDRAEDVARRWRDLADDAPDELSTACVVLTAPPELA